jgi:hypothetical protein
MEEGEEGRKLASDSELERGANASKAAAARAGLSLLC